MGLGRAREREGLVKKVGLDLGTERHRRFGQVGGDRNEENELEQVDPMTAFGQDSGVSLKAQSGSEVGLGGVWLGYGRPRKSRTSGSSWNIHTLTHEPSVTWKVFTAHDVALTTPFLCPTTVTVRSLEWHSMT